VFAIVLYVTLTPFATFKTAAATMTHFVVVPLATLLATSSLIVTTSATNTKTIYKRKGYNAVASVPYPGCEANVAGDGSLDVSAYATQDNVQEDCWRGRYGPNEYLR
jgi:hypothetical protein